MGELLNCSAGSDDVFDTKPGERAQDDAGRAPAASDLDQLAADPGAEEDEACVWRWVAEVARPQWGALCGACAAPLDTHDATHSPQAATPHRPPRPHAALQERVVALAACHHVLHLRCLQNHLERLRENGVRSGHVVASDRASIRRVVH